MMCLMREGRAGHDDGRQADDAKLVGNKELSLASLTPLQAIAG